jgi:hypothetical protein
MMEKEVRRRSCKVRSRGLDWQLDVEFEKEMLMTEGGGVVDEGGMQSPLGVEMVVSLWGEKAFV